MEERQLKKIAVETFLARSNLSRKVYRTVCLSALVAISSAVLYASLIIAFGLKSGILGLRSRLGADLLVVPDGYEKGEENVLLYGEPNYFYMERSVLDVIQNIAGIEKASGQFYLTSLSESCCDFPIQIIGFDRNSDFVVQAWKQRKRGSNVLDSEVFLCGSNVVLSQGNVKLFGSIHKVSGKLLRSGTGMDNTIFCDLETLQNIFNDARSKGFGFISDGEVKNKISSVLVTVSKDYSVDAVALKIKNAISDVQVIVGNDFIKRFSERISSILIFIHVIAGLIFVMVILTLSIAFSIVIQDRRREFSILRVLGANRKMLRRIMLLESSYIGGIGSAVGIATASLIVIPFNAVISEKIALPFAMCSIEITLLLAVFVFVLCTAACIFASMNSAVRLSRVEPYGDVK